ETQFENLGGQNPSGPIAEKALYFAGESAMSTMGPHSLDRAIELFDRVVQMKGEWRWSARNEQAVIERRLGKPRDALLLYDEVLEEQARPDHTPEFFWYYKAGFNAARLLEDAAKWDSAATVYEKLAAAGGTRSEEAQARLSRLRLEHFLWGN